MNSIERSLCYRIYSTHQISNRSLILLSNIFISETTSIVSKTYFHFLNVCFGHISLCFICLFLLGSSFSELNGSRCGPCAFYAVSEQERKLLDKLAKILFIIFLLFRSYSYGSAFYEAVLTNKESSFDFILHNS